MQTLVEESTNSVVSSSHVEDKCLPEDGSLGTGCDSWEVSRGWEKGRCGVST
jgi:hypothetical protein